VLAKLSNLASLAIDGNPCMATTTTTVATLKTAKAAYSYIAGGAAAATEEGGGKKKKKEAQEGEGLAGQRGVPARAVVVNALRSLTDLVRKKGKKVEFVAILVGCLAVKWPCKDK
jgi:hypothetical protein